MHRMLKSFIFLVSCFSRDEFYSWLREGMMACYPLATHGVASTLPETAFRGARLSFGQRGAHRTAVDELASLYNNLDKNAQSRFRWALAQLLSSCAASPTPLLNAALELSLETVCSEALPPLTEKIRASANNPEARDWLCLKAAFFLDEFPPSVSIRNLANTIREMRSFPDVIAAKLLVSLCRSDADNSDFYAKELREKLRVQMHSLAEYRPGYQRFRSDLWEALKSASAFTKSQIAKDKFYTELLPQLSSDDTIVKARTRNQTLAMVISALEPYQLGCTSAINWGST